MKSKTIAVQATLSGSAPRTASLLSWRLPDGSQAKQSEVQEALLASFSDQPVPDRLAAIHGREQCKARMGNLTLLHYGVNRSLQHHAFDEKRKEFFEHSNLHLNRELMLMKEWNDEAIEQRGRTTFEVAKQIWRGPQ